MEKVTLLGMISYSQNKYKPKPKHTGALVRREDLLSTMQHTGALVRREDLPSTMQHTGALVRREDLLSTMQKLVMKNSGF